MSVIFLMFLSYVPARAQDYQTVFDSFLIEAGSLPEDEIRRHFFRLRMAIDGWPTTEKMAFLEKWLTSESSNNFSPVVNFEVSGILHLLYVDQRKYDDAIQLAKRREKISEDNSNWRFYLTTLLNRADLYTKMEEYDSAYHYVNRTLEESKLYDLYDDRSGTLIALATIHRKTGQLEKSKSVLEEALSLTADNHRNKGYLLYLLVELSYEMDSIRAYVDYGNQLLTEMDFEPHLAIREHNILEEIILTGNTNESRNKLSNTIDYMSQGSHVSGLYQYSVIAFASKCQNFSDTINFLLPKVLTLVSKIEDQADQTGVAPFYRLLSKIFEKQGDAKKALAYFQKYNETTFSELKLDQQEKIAELEVQYDAESKKRKILEQEILLKSEVNRRRIMILVFGLLLLLGSVLLYTYRKRLNLLKLLKAKEIEEVKQKQNLEMANAVIDTQERERTRIARELHDDLGGVMSSIRMKIEELEARGALEETSPGELSQRMEYACDRLRAISHEMIPLSFSVVGLEASISDLVADIQTQGLDVDYEWVGNAEGMKKERAINVYRILQELFHNTIKHANANQVMLQVFIKDGMQILFEDDGKGFDTNSTTNGIGMQNINSRVSYLGGEILIDSVIDQGTTTTINIPLEDG